MKKRWVVTKPLDEDVLKKFSDINPVTLQLLWNRGVVCREDMDEFLNPIYENSIHDPFLFDDMHTAVTRIISAIRNKERIVIYGDYDVDGICASTVLIDFLSLFNADIETYLPHREKEGYGLKIPAIEKLKERGAQLIITDDSGISNRQEVIFANSLDIDVIITDHHHPPKDEKDLPPAVAIIHPEVHANRYPFKYLAGVGSAFKLVQGLVRADFDEWFREEKNKILNEQGNPMNWEAYEKWLLDVVCIATVTDCMPLRGENRTIVKYGLKVLNKTRREGLRALLSNSGKAMGDFDTQTIGFFIGPRINAASRMEHASIALDLMTSRHTEKAVNYVALLEKTNSERQELSDRMTNEAIEMVKSSYDDGNNILIAISDTWPIGVLGLVAGRVMNTYNRPVILATSANGHTDGTARSLPCFNVAESFAAHADFFERYGGHAAAGGFSMKSGSDFDELKRRMESYAREYISEEDLIPVITIDKEISLVDVNWDLWNIVQSFEPCGQANPRPNFLIRNLDVVENRSVGKDGKHLKLAVRQGGVVVKGIGFSLGQWSDIITEEQSIDVVAEITLNEWNGKKNIELMVTDIALAGESAV